MARRDHLTGLYNRRGFEHQLAGARRFRRGGALLVLDLDGFKAVNDSFGHRAGDELLRGIAVGLKERLRATDVLDRRVRMTASIGCALFDGDQAAHEILAAADAEMYAAKRAA